jgi:hypothetical protein
MSSNVYIDINKLKEDVKDHVMTPFLSSRKDEFTKRRLAYWWSFRRMKRYHNFLSIPLLITSNATGVTSAAQISGKFGLWLSIVVTILGISSGILSAMQKFFAFAERAEHSKYMAKSYARIVRRIEKYEMYVMSGAATMDSESFTEFIEDIQKDIDTVSQQAEDIPREILQTVDEYTKTHLPLPPQ